VSWLTDPEEAAKHPRRVLALVLVSGLVGGGAIGYFRFGRSPVWAVILGVTIAAILAYAARSTLRDPARVQRQKSLPEIRKSLLRLALPFLALAVAFVVGAAVQSVHVFIVVFASALAVGLALRFTVWR
jgi:hypothetical protein